MTRFCEKHGHYETTQSDEALWSIFKQEPQCPKCAEEIIKQDEEEKLKSLNLDELSEQRITEKMRSAEIPENKDDRNNLILARRKTLRLNTKDRQELSLKIEPFLEREIQNMVILGGTGVGKTYFAAVVMAEFFRKNLNGGKDGLYITEREIQGKVINEDGFKKRINSTDLLIIDEIGATGWKDPEQKLVCSLIRDRDAFGRQTILLGNITKIEFDKHYDDAVLSRLKRKNNYRYNFIGKDLRI